MNSLRKTLPELDALEQLLEGFPIGQVRTLDTVHHARQSLPIHAVLLGPEDKSLPTLLFVGGVHGLERVGTQVLLSYLRTLKAALTWDTVLCDMLTRMRLLFVPLLNPAGMALGLRSNARGVDLMRNAPVLAEQRSRWFELYRGQRITPFLPWYQGKQGEAMEVESSALCEFVEQELFPSRCAIAIDVHSGFLAGDRIWFPYARSLQPFPHTPEIMALTQLLGETHEGHVYTIEPQSINYTTHGDLWDHVYDLYRRSSAPGTLLPLTLELSSRLWYRKNPRQLMRRTGLFHPVKAHRLARVQRRHKTLFDFLTRAVVSHERWLPATDAHRSTLLREAHERWFNRF